MNMSISRKYTNKILKMHDDGLLNTEFLLRNLLMWMSEHEVKQFYESVISCDDEEVDAEAALDDFNYVGSSQHY
jgi:hypothetical protein